MKKGELTKRLLVAAWGIPALLGLTYLGGYWFALLISVISIIAMHEYYRLHEKLERRPLRFLGWIIGLGVICGWIFVPEQLVWIIVFSYIIFAFASVFTHRSHLDLIAGFTGVIYIPLLAGCFLVVRGWSVETEISFYDGRWLAFCIWSAIWIGDTAAYAGGRMFGKHPLAPRTSPKKTVEGFIAGLIGAFITVMAWWLLDLVRFDIALVVGFAAGLFGQIGDLVESALKREAGVKDTSAMLPGHGGFLDRFDSMLATAPIVALYLLLFADYWQ